MFALTASKTKEDLPFSQTTKAELVEAVSPKEFIKADEVKE